MSGSLMSTTNLTAILSQLRAEIESRIREEISGPLNTGKRFLYDAVMPIRLNIIGDSQECNLEFLPGGNVQLHSGLASNPDVSVKGDLANLSDVILQRSGRLFDEAKRSGRIVVTSHSWKGEQAMQKVRELLSSNP
jgi:hypothetical protein